MALTATLVKRWAEIKAIYATFTVAASGSYVAGGEVLGLAAKVGWNQKLPMFVSIRSRDGYIYTYDPVTDKMQVRVNTTPGVNAPFPEHTAAAYNAGVVGDLITLMAVFPKG